MPDVRWADRFHPGNEAKDNIIKSQNYSQEYFNRKHKPARTFEAGEWVAIEYIDTTPGTNKKLNPTHRGPYQIHKVLPNDRYVIRDIENIQITNMPKDGIVEACKLRKWSSPLTKQIDSLPSTDTCNELDTPDEIEYQSQSDPDETNEFPEDDIDEQAYPDQNHYRTIHLQIDRLIEDN